MTLKVVELHPQKTASLGSLQDRIMDCAYDYVEHIYETEGRRVAKSEIIGILEFVKAEIMGLEFE